MAWSDAARRAALEMRRRRLKGVYHGGPPMRGTHVEPRAGGVFSTRDLTQAMLYAKDKDGFVYRVAPPRKMMSFDKWNKAAREMDKTKRGAFFKNVAWRDSMGGGTVYSVRSPVKILRRLPSLRVRGRISRGR